MFTRRQLVTASTMALVMPAISRAQDMPGVTATEAGARVVVRRSPQVMGATATYVVLFDGRPVANLGSGESTSFPAPAGVHVIGLECGGRGVFGQSNQISADLAPGRTYTITAFASLTRGCEMRYEVS